MKIAGAPAMEIPTRPRRRTTGMDNQILGDQAPLFHRLRRFLHRGEDSLVGIVCLSLLKPSSPLCGCSRMSSRSAAEVA